MNVEGPGDADIRGDGLGTLRGLIMHGNGGGYGPDHFRRLGLGVALTGSVGGGGKWAERPTPKQPQLLITTDAGGQQRVPLATLEG